MDSFITPVTDFAEAVAAGRADRFEAAIKTAYEAGASREALVMAVDVARALGTVSARIVSQAYADIHRWQWIAARRRTWPFVLPVRPA